MVIGVDAEMVRDDETDTASWSEFLEDMDGLADEFEADGWEPLILVAGDTAAIGSDHKGFDHHGFVYVVPGDDGEQFADVFEPGRFTEADVYKAPGGSHQFFLTVLREPDLETAIFLAGALERNSLRSCKQAAMKTDRMYSHVVRIDGTHLGSVAHDNPEVFFPDFG